jgi:PHS family inorganic phosphate transporter-like MFS transporter
MGRDEREALESIAERESLMAHQSQSRRDSMPNVLAAAAAAASSSPRAHPTHSSARMLAGTCLVWFLFDVSFYANSMFNSSILQTLGIGDSLPQLTLMTLYITLIALPGYFIGIYLITKFPLFWIQVLGFALLTFLYLILAFVDIKSLNGALLLIIYGLTFLVSNAGPNLTTYVIPVSIFPTEVRMAYHGYSAACGKLGALVGTALLKPVLDRWGVSVVLAVCAIFSAMGMVVTFMCIPTKIGQDTNNNPSATTTSSEEEGSKLEEDGSNKQI